MAASTTTSSSLVVVGPPGYEHVRIEAAASNNSSAFVRAVEDRPYFPLLKVDSADEATVVAVAKAIINVSHNSNQLGACEQNDETKKNDVCQEEGGDTPEPKVTVITGGLTNALFKVDLGEYTNDNSSNKTTSVLVRIFGAEGLINRDVETTNFARLCNNSSSASVVHSQLDLLGRFQNGRVETWISNMRQAHHIHDLEKEGCALEVARQIARIHYGFDLDRVALEEGGSEEGVGVGASSSSMNMKQSHVDGRIRELQPSLWKVIASWIEELYQHLSSNEGKFQDYLLALFNQAAATSMSTTSSDKEVTALAIKEALTSELAWLKNQVETKFSNAPVVFCHNDVNAANILLNTSIDSDKHEHEHDGTDTGNSNNTNTPYTKDSVCIIDYEYGSINYAMYDIANYVCEHCGGNDNGIPNFDLLPSSVRMVNFLEEYVAERDLILAAKVGHVNNNSSSSSNNSTMQQQQQVVVVANLHAQVETFQMASNLYWGLWGVLQAAGEVADGTFVNENAKERLEGTSDLDKWDNLRYGKSRLERYHILKERE